MDTAFVGFKTGEIRHIRPSWIVRNINQVSKLFFQHTPGGGMHLKAELTGDREFHMDFPSYGEFAQFTANRVFDTIAHFDGYSVIL